MGWTERELVERTAWMRRLAHGLTRDAHQADDLVQEAWVAALESGARPRSPRAWFRAVLSKRLSSERRTRGRRADRERDAARREGVPPADQAAQRVELQEQLARALFSLEEPYRQALALRYFQGWPPRRIAAELGIEARAAEARLRRGLEQLRRKLDAQHDGRREQWLGGLLALGGGGSLWKPAAVAAAALALASVGAVTAAAWRGADLHEARSEPVAAAALPADMSADSSAGDPASAAPLAAPPRSPAPGGAEVAVVTLLREGDDQPLAGVPVLWETGRLTTDDAGVAQLPWPAARAFTVSMTDSTREAPLSVAGPGAHVLRVPRRGGTLSGFVIDLEGHPVPHAEVRFFTTLQQGRAMSWDAPARSVSTDARGAFEAHDLADWNGRSTPYQILASAPGFFSTCSTGGNVVGAGNPPALLVVEPVRGVAGRVSAWDRAAVSDAPLLAYSRNPESYERTTALLDERRAGGARFWGKPQRYPALYLLTNEDGGFLLPKGAEPWHLEVHHPDYPRWRGWIEEQTFVDVFLDAGVALSGQVVDAAGLAVSGAEVQLYSEEDRGPLRTDSDGRFRFKALTPLEGALVAVTAAGHACAVVPVDLDRGETTVDVRLERERVVSGRLVDSAGDPLAGETLDIRGDRIVGTAWIPRSRGMTWEQLVSPVRWRTHTDQDGRFEFRGLYPGEFRVRTGQARTAATWARVPAAGLPWQLVDGDLTGSATVRGSVRLPSGEVAGLVNVLLHPFVEGESEARPDLVGDTFPGEHFELAGLDPGRWRLEVRTQDQSASWTGPIQDLGPGVHGFDVRLEPTGR